MGMPPFQGSTSHSAQQAAMSVLPNDRVALSPSQPSHKPQTSETDLCDPASQVPNTLIEPMITAIIPNTLLTRYLLR